MFLLLLGTAASAINCEWNEKEYVMSITTDSTSIVKLLQSDIKNSENIRKLLVVSMAITALGEGMMKDKTKLREVILNSNINNIGKHCFNGCSSLELIHLPAKLSTISEGAFDGCINLKKIILSTQIGILGTDLIKGSGIETIILLAAASIYSKNIQSAALGNTDKLREFVYCGKKNWAGSIASDTFLNSPIASTFPKVPSDYSDSSFLGYGINKVDVTNICSGAKNEINANIDWNNEKEHGYPDPEIIPTSEDININFYSSYIEPTIGIKDSSITQDEHEDIVTESSINLIATRDIITDKSTLKSVSHIDGQESIAKESHFKTNIMNIISEESTNTISFEEKSTDITDRFELDKKSSENDENENVFESSKNIEYSSDFYEIAPSPSINDENNPIVWKPEIVLLIIQKISKVERNDIINEFGPIIYDNVGKLVVKPGVEALGDSLMERSNYLSEVVITDSVTSIGEKCFFNCPVLKKIRLPNGLSTIKDKAFSQCYQLETLVLPDRILSLGSYLIENSGFRNITLLNTTVSASSGLYIYSGAKSLEKFYYCGDTYPGKMTNINAFKDTTGKILVPPTFKDMFSGHYSFLNYVATRSDIESYCKETDSLQKKDIDWDYEITNGCDPLPTPSLSPTPSSSPSPSVSATSFIPSPSPSVSATYKANEIPVIWQMDNSVLILQNEKNISNEKISYYVKHNITLRAEKLVIKPDVVVLENNLMDGYINLREVIMADTVEEIGDCCFRDCYRLEKIKLSKNLTSIGDEAFKNTYMLKNIVFPNKITSLGEKIISGSGIVDAVMLNTTIRAKHVGYYVFGYASDLEEFYYCGNFYKYHPFFSIKAFGESNKLGDIAVPETFDDRYASDIPDLFLHYTVKKINIDKVCNDAEKYSEEAIDWEHETSIDRGKNKFEFDETSGTVYTNFIWLDSDATNYYFSVFGINKIRVLKLGDETEELNKRCIENCQSLTTVQFGNNFKKIGDYCFYNCVKLDNIVLPSTIEYIGEFAFSKCSSLRNIVIPADISFIGSGILSSSGIKNIVYLVPNNMESQEINIDAFMNLPEIESFTYCGRSYTISDGDNYIDHNIKVSVDYKYNLPEFLGREVVREDIGQVCQNAEEYNLKFPGSSRIAISVTFFVIFLASVIIVVLLSMLCNIRLSKCLHAFEDSISPDELDEINIEEVDSNSGN